MTFAIINLKNIAKSEMIVIYNLVLLKTGLVSTKQSLELPNKS
jgi:hypothetical protein